jgi:response regulator RpfG family c-di-GMP phosphodiesterase
MPTSHRLLFVDDDPNALAGFQRALKDHFEVEVAQGSQHGLSALATRPPYAVVIADMRMPVMNGVQFLRRVYEVAPDTVRIMLTGNADLQTAIDAVNEGFIFQFLCKPCPTPQLTKTLAAGVAHYDLICRERELLEKTLQGSVKVLTELLSLVNPAAFGRAMRMADTVRQMAAATPWRDAWKFEMAAMLSQLGCITLTAEMLEAVRTGVLLSAVDRARVDAHPLVARDLIAHIPRLGEVAEMIARQREPYQAKTGIGDARDLITAGARMLHLALDLDAVLSAGVSHDDAVAQLAARDGEYDPALLHAIRTHAVSSTRKRTARVPLDALEPGMVMEQELRTGAGLLLAAKGQTMTPALLQRIQNFLRISAIWGEVQVTLVPDADARQGLHSRSPAR